MSTDKDMYLQTLGLYNDPAYAQKYASNIEDHFDEWMFKEFLPYLPAKATILDVGSAAGRDTAYLAKKGYRVIGLDFSHEFTDIAAQKYPDLTFIEGDFTKLMFGPNSFDGIWCKAALVHLPSQKLVEKSLTEFNKVIKPGGFIMIVTKARINGQPQVVIRNDKFSAAERYFRLQDEEEFNDLLNTAGFKVLKSKVYNEREGQQYKVMRDENWLFVVAQKPDEKQEEL